jgi:hypothetical protein
MKKVLTIVTAALWLGAAQPGGALSASADARVTDGTVKVTVHYKGKGKVDPSHKIWVWLFDSPNIGPGSMPIGQVALDKNDTDAVFDAGAATQVWIAVAYDESGAMTGEGPPPTGTPIGILTSKEGAPAPVTPGDKGTVSLTFDESIRMP